MTRCNRVTVSVRLPPTKLILMSESSKAHPLLSKVKLECQEPHSWAAGHRTVLIMPWPQLGVIPGLPGGLWMPYSRQCRRLSASYVSSTVPTQSVCWVFIVCGIGIIPILMMGAHILVQVLATAAQQVGKMGFILPFL